MLVRRPLYFVGHLGAVDELVVYYHLFGQLICHLVSHLVGELVG